MKRILVVEDEAAYLKLLHDQLTRNGYLVADAQDGEEGLKLALGTKPDLILLDIVLPKVDGLKMLKALRTDIWGKTVPVFILTNINQSGEISEAMNDRVSRYIIKSDLKLRSLMDDINIFLQRV